MKVRIVKYSWLDFYGEPRSMMRIDSEIGGVLLKLTGEVTCRVAEKILRFKGIIPDEGVFREVQDEVIDMLWMLSKLKVIRWAWFENAKTLEEIQEKLALKVVLGVNVG